MKSPRILLRATFVVFALLLVASNSPYVDAACVGVAPLFGGIPLTCIGDFWQSLGSIMLTNCSSTRITGPTIINGNLTLDFRSLLTYEPPSLSATPLITVKGCAFFNQSFIRINLTREWNKDLIYAQELKQKNHWLYLNAIETSCPSIDVTSLSFQTEIHWPYGVAINSTVITSKKNKITYLPLEPGHSAIQIGFLGGSPLGSQSWFPALLAIIGCCMLIVIVGVLIQHLTSHSVEKKKGKREHKSSINGDHHDDSATVSLLDDTD